MQHLRYLLTVSPTGAVIAIEQLPPAPIRPPRPEREKKASPDLEAEILAAVRAAELKSPLRPLKNVKAIAAAIGRRHVLVGKGIKRLVEAGRITKCPLGYIASDTSCR